jgi:hypothetical protein
MCAYQQSPIPANFLPGFSVLPLIPSPALPVRRSARLSLAECFSPHTSRQRLQSSSYGCRACMCRPCGVSVQAAAPRKRGRGRPAGSKTRVRSDKERLPSTPAGALGFCLRSRWPIMLPGVRSRLRLSGHAPGAAAPSSSALGRTLCSTAAEQQQNNLPSPGPVWYSPKLTQVHVDS